LEVEKKYPLNNILKLYFLHVLLSAIFFTRFIGLPRASAEKFPGRASEKRSKISKKYRKIALFSLFQGGGGGNGKRPKNSKKRPKIALLSLYLLYLYHV